MTPGGYLGIAESRPRSIGLGIVIAAHVAVLAAVMLAKGVLISPPPPPFVVTNYPADTTKPPPPTPADPATNARTFAEPMPVPIPTPADPTIPTIDLPRFPTIDPIPTGTGGGAAMPTGPIDPVLVEARIDPRYAGDFQPLYPASAERDGISGKAVVRVHIGADGRVRSIDLVRTDDPAFFQATERQALRRWRFSPAMRDGVAVESVKVLTVSFILNG